MMTNNLAIMRHPSGMAESKKDLTAFLRRKPIGSGIVTRFSSSTLPIGACFFYMTKKLCAIKKRLTVHFCVFFGNYPAAPPSALT
ncbi:MAG: hypothetical protein PHI06_00950 [Desulfobulbaceae bacterium]|nr:hypothetical protein [Desulfobulbaceae bacterium]